MAEDSEGRGSDKLLESLIGTGGTELSKQQLRKMIELTRGSGAKIIDWWELGQPAPEWVGGAAVIDRGQVGRLVEGLLAAGPRIVLDGFPFGIPDPRELIVKFQVSQQQGQ